MTPEVSRGGVSPQLNEEWGQKMCSIVQSGIPGNYIDKDMHYELTEQNGS